MESSQGGIKDQSMAVSEKRYVLYGYDDRGEEGMKQSSASLPDSPPALYGVAKDAAAER